MITKEALKLYFEKGDYPTQNQFWEWMDSYWHKEEKIPQDSVEAFEKVIPLFDGNNLIGSGIKLTIPSNTKKIFAAAYSYEGFNYQIREVLFNEGLEEIGQYAFSNQNIKVIKTPSTLKLIGSNAFDSQSNTRGTGVLEKIILNEGLIRIEDSVFLNYKAAVNDLYIPNTVQSVGKNAFLIPSLQSVSAPAGLDLSASGIPETAVITYRQ